LYYTLKASRLSTAKGHISLLKKYQIQARKNAYFYGKSLYFLLVVCYNNHNGKVRARPMAAMPVPQKSNENKEKTS